MLDKNTSKRPHTLFFSPPGSYPAVANLGLEIVIDAVKKGAQVSIETIRSDLFLCRHIKPELQNKVANLDVMDFFYADSCFPRFSTVEQRGKRDAYLLANGVTPSEKKAIKKALWKLERFFKDYLEEKKPKVLAISLNSDRLITALQYVQFARMIIPSIRIIMGGAALQGEVGASVFSCFPEIDYLVTGRGEFAAREVIERINCGEEVGSIPGLLFSRNPGAVVQVTKKLHQSPFPLPEMDDFYEDLVRLTEQHGRDAFGNMYGIAVIQSAGCWWGKCDFCSEPDYQKGYFLEDCRVISRYIHRIARRFHISDIFFLDSIQPPAAHLRKLCQLLNRHAIPYRISSEIHASIDDETLDLLLESGFKTLQIGIETYSQDLLVKMNKGIELIRLIHILLKCYNKSVSIQGNLLMHHPSETPDNVRETIQVVNTTAHLFSPFLQHYFVAHGSPLSSYLDSKGVKTYPLMRQSLLYPRSHRRKMTFSYRYLPEKRKTYAMWRRLKDRQARAKRTERQILMYVDGGESIKIIDSRNNKRKSYSMSKLDRDVIIACTHPCRRSEVQSLIPQSSASMLSQSMDRLVQAKVLFQQGDRYLTLATPWRNIWRALP